MHGAGRMRFGECISDVAHGAHDAGNGQLVPAHEPRAE
jgi:hypothetical protein